MTERTSTVSNLILEHADGGGSKQTRPRAGNNGSGCENPEAGMAKPSRARLWSEIRDPKECPSKTSGLGPSRQRPHANAANPAWAKLRNVMNNPEDATAKADANEPERQKLRGDTELPEPLMSGAGTDVPSLRMPQTETAGAGLARLRGSVNKPGFANADANTRKSSHEDECSGTELPDWTKSTTGKRPPVSHKLSADRMGLSDATPPTNDPTSKHALPGADSAEPN